MDRHRPSSTGPRLVCQERAFKHTPLDLKTNVTRVLRILPGPECSALECELKILDYEHWSEYQFTCLSYVWGPSDENDCIRIDGQIYPVRKNLCDFLHTARAMGLRQWLWIDAISIDQKNIHERNQQYTRCGRSTEIDLLSSGPAEWIYAPNL